MLKYYQKNLSYVIQYFSAEFKWSNNAGRNLTKIRNSSMGQLPQNFSPSSSEKLVIIFASQKIRK